MNSCIWLERPAAWRAAALAVVFALATLPAWPLGWLAISCMDAAALSGSFWAAMGNSVVTAGIVAAVAFAIGLPAGTAAALFDFPGRRPFLAATTVPLLVPSFLLAIGWSSLAVRLGPDTATWVNGRFGCCLVFLAGAVPLVLWITFAATMSLGATQIESARLAGGDRATVAYAARSVATSALLASSLAGILTLSDPGPGQILGGSTAASSILTSFASLYDYRLAARQCATLALLAMACTLPIVAMVGCRFSAQILARQLRPLRRQPSDRFGFVPVAWFAAILLGLLVAPLIGLVLPLSSLADLARAWKQVERTLANTVIYAIGAAAVAAAMGFLTAVCVGRQARLQSAVFSVCIALVALPPALGALGVIAITNNMPHWLDWLVRSRLTVCLELGLRFFPVSAVIVLRSWGSMSSSWTEAAALHGISTMNFLWKVVVPNLTPALSASILLIALLTTADVGSVLLLHPPGQASLPLAIFAVMANAPESLVASLCFMYLALAFGVTALFLLATRRTMP